MPNHSTEIWKDIPGYEGLYQASNLGRVKSLMRILAEKNDRRRLWRERILKLAQIPHTKYWYITLCNADGQKRFYVHRLVLMAFVGPRPEGMECLHGDDNRSNNRLENLRWGTRQENVRQMIEHGRQVCADMKGEKNPSAKLNEKKVRRLRKQYASGKYNQTELAKRYGVSQETVSGIVLHNTWKNIGD